MTFDKLKEQCQKHNHAVMASMKSNGDVFIYVNPDADVDEVAKSMTILAVNVAQHMQETQR